MTDDIKHDWQFAHFGDDKQRLWSEDPHMVRFFERLQAQADKDKADTRRRNDAKRAMFRRSPAMAAADALTGVFGGFEPDTEADFKHGLQLLVHHTLTDPLVSRYQNYLNYGRAPHPNTEWWHAFGHQQIATASVASAATRSEFIGSEDLQRLDMPVVWDSRLFPLADDFPQMLRDIGPREMSFEIAGRIDKAQTYLWTQDCLEAAVAAPLVAHTVVPNALPFDEMFFSFEMAAWVEQATASDWDENPMPNGLHAETWWVAVFKLGDAGMLIVLQKQLWPHAPGWNPQEHILFEPVAWDMKWPDDFEGRRSQLEIGNVLRMLSFMQAPFVDATPIKRRLTRMEGRRDYERKGSPAPEPAVSIVTLRRPLHEPLFTSPQEGDNGSTREYKHSWWVGGHYRWQFYPSTQDHKLIAIAPYMKQIGKPLLPRLHIVKD